MSHGEEIWIGLAHIRPTEHESFLTPYAGAFVNALVLCSDRAEYIDRLTKALDHDLHVSVESIEDIEPLRTRRLRGELDPQIRELSQHLAGDHPVDFDDFQFYVSDDD